MTSSRRFVEDKLEIARFPHIKQTKNWVGFNRTVWKKGVPENRQIFWGEEEQQSDWVFVFKLKRLIRSLRRRIAPLHSAIGGMRSSRPTKFVCITTDCQWQPLRWNIPTNSDLSYKKSSPHLCRLQIFDFIRFRESRLWLPCLLLLSGQCRQW